MKQQLQGPIFSTSLPPARLVGRKCACKCMLRSLGCSPVKISHADPGWAFEGFETGTLQMSLHVDGPIKAVLLRMVAAW